MLLSGDFIQAASEGNMAEVPIIPPLENRDWLCNVLYIGVSTLSIGNWITRAPIFPPANSDFPGKQNNETYNNCCPRTAHIFANRYKSKTCPNLNSWFPSQPIIYMNSINVCQLCVNLVIFCELPRLGEFSLTGVWQKWYVICPLTA